MRERAEQSLVSTRSIVSGVVVGLIHAGIAVVLWNRWFDTLWGLLVTKPLTGGYILLGMFLLGFVPAVFYSARRVVSPAVIISIALFLSGALSWQSGTVRAPAGAPTPFGLYLLSWIAIVTIASVVGRVESHRRFQAPS